MRHAAALILASALLGCASAGEPELIELEGPHEVRLDDEPRIPTRAGPAPTEPTRAAAPSSHDAPRECVQDLEADAAARWQAEFEEPVYGEDEEPWLRVELPDVDGDGEPETMLSVTDQCGIANCPRLIYTSGLRGLRGQDERGGERCRRFVGALWSAYEEVLPARQRGLANLRTYLKNGCAGTAGLFTTYGFDGERYAAMDSIDCRCLADGPDPGRDPLCPGDE